MAKNEHYMEEAWKQVLELANEVWDKRMELKFDVPPADIDNAIETALAAEESTVFITDSGDNINAGAAGDGTLVLQRLLIHKVPDAVLAGIVDPKALAEWFAAVVEALLNLTVGGKVDTIFSKSFPIQGTVLDLPLAHQIVVVQEGYLFQGLRDIAPLTIMALTPGFACQPVENLPYQNLHRPIYPIYPEMEWSAAFIE